jgi:mRNA interferase MazF
VLVPFPFSDLSQAKLRPAIVMADAGRHDWILCPVTSRPYGDDRAITITDQDFETGGLRVASAHGPENYSRRMRRC